MRYWKNLNRICYHSAVLSIRRNKNFHFGSPLKICDWSTVLLFWIFLAAIVRNHQFQHIHWFLGVAFFPRHGRIPVVWSLFHVKSFHPWRELRQSLLMSKIRVQKVIKIHLVNLMRRCWKNMLKQRRPGYDFGFCEFPNFSSLRNYPLEIFTATDKLDFHYHL